MQIKYNLSLLSKVHFVSFARMYVIRSEYYLVANLVVDYLNQLMNLPTSCQMNC